MNRRWSRHQAAMALAVAAAVLIAASGLPLLQLVFELAASGAAGVRLLATARPWQLLGHSLALGCAVTAATLLVGVPLGVLVGRTDLVGRRLLWALHGFPMALPPFLLALGWSYALGSPGGPGTDAARAALFGPAGVVWVLALVFTPLVTSLVAVALMGVDPAQEEAARVVARPARVVARILLPAVAPAVALAGLLVFVLTVSELGVPMFLRVDVFPAAVFARLGGIDFAPGEAFGLALPLVPMVAGLVVLERRLVGRRSFAVLGLGRGRARAPLPLGRWRLPLSMVAWVAAVIALLPLAALAREAAAGASIRDLLSWARFAPLNSVVASTAAATVVTLLGIVIGHALARGRSPAGAIDALALLSFVTPAAVLGVGLMALWNRPATSAVYSSFAILVITFVARYAVIGLRTAAVALAQVPLTVEEAASVSGASYARRLRRIVVPAAGRGVGFAWLATFVFCLRDLESAVLLYPPGGEPLTVRIFTLEANGPAPIVAGLGCLHVVLTAAVVALGAWVLRGTSAP